MKTGTWPQTKLLTGLASPHHLQVLHQFLVFVVISIIKSENGSLESSSCFISEVSSEMCGMATVTTSPCFGQYILPSSLLSITVIPQTLTYLMIMSDLSPSQPYLPTSGRSTCLEHSCFQILWVLSSNYCLSIQNYANISLDLFIHKIPHHLYHVEMLSITLYNYTILYIYTFTH